MVPGGKGTGLHGEHTEAPHRTGVRCAGRRQENRAAQHENSHLCTQDGISQEPDDGHRWPFGIRRAALRVSRRLQRHRLGHWHMLHPSLRRRWVRWRKDAAGIRPRAALSCAKQRSPSSAAGCPDVSPVASAPLPAGASAQAMFAAAGSLVCPLAAPVAPPEMACPGCCEACGQVARG